MSFYIFQQDQVCSRGTRKFGSKSSRLPHSTDQSKLSGQLLFKWWRNRLISQWEELQNHIAKGREYRKAINTVNPLKREAFQDGQPLSSATTHS